MPKSRNRKNHKKKVESWKNRKQQQINAANKEIQKIQENLIKQLLVILVYLIYRTLYQII